MSKEKIRTIPNLIDGSPNHQAALDSGTEHFKSWAYNVADHFKDKTVEEIKASLKETAHPFAVCAENIIGDFNIGTLMRNANAFNAKEIFYIGNKKFDRRGMVGVHNYNDIQWLPTIEDFISLKNKYTIIGIDNIAGSVSISKFKFKPNTLFVFGEEGVGLTPTIQSLCEATVSIEQFGSVRSLNVGVASGIIMYEFVKQARQALFIK